MKYTKAKNGEMRRWSRLRRVPGFIQDQADVLLIRMNRRKRAQEREVLLPVLPHDTLADIVLDVLDDVPRKPLTKKPLGNQGLLLLEHGQDDQGAPRGDDR